MNNTANEVTLNKKAHSGLVKRAMARAGFKLIEKSETRWVFEKNGELEIVNWE
jgi:transcriptional/translational regulatory protein YebC/TACO1